MAKRTDFTKWPQDKWNKVRTFDGKRARILDVIPGEKPLVVKFQDKTGQWHSAQMKADGVYHKSDSPFIVPEPEYGFMNIRERSNGSREGGTVYPTKDEALKRATANTVHKAVPVPL